MSTARTTFIVCTRNNRDIIDVCLRSIEGQTDPDWELFVVDDASTDGTAELVQTNYPRAKLLRRTKGIGPSINRNWAMESITTEFVATIDSDVELSPEWLARTRAYLEEHRDVGIVGGKLLYASNPQVINSYGGQTGWIGIGWDGYEGRASEELTEAVNCLWVCSAAMLARREVLAEVGGFDETFFYGYEDSDIGWRVNLFGHRCVCIPDALAYHRARTTIGPMGAFITFHYHKNRVRSLLKNTEGLRLLGILPVYAGYSVLDLALRAPRWAKLQAWWWSVTHLAETLRLRRAIQSQRQRTGASARSLIESRILPPTRLSGRAKFRTASGVQTPQLSTEAKDVQ